MSEDPDALPVSLSEVGCNPEVPHDQTEDRRWELLLEQQNRNFMALVQAIKKPNSPRDLKLPDFDPKKTDVNARAWISTADMCIADQEQQGPKLMVALSHALKGDASTWLSTIAFPGMTWSDFKALFIARYECPETIASFLINLHGNKPKDDECIAAYAASLMSSLMSRWNTHSTEQIAIGIVLAHISQFNPRVQRLAFTHDIKTRNELQQELKAVSFMKRKMNSDQDGPDSKRARFSTVPKPVCYTCGKHGHKSVSCNLRVKPTSRKIDERPKSSSSVGTGDKSSVTCFHCQARGHYASSCPKRISKPNASNPGASSSEKRIDVCNVNAHTGHLRTSGEQFLFHYDSGAECSLVRESVACKLQGKRLHNTVTMTGIGQTSVYSTMQIETVVEIDDIAIVVVFHVLPDHYLRYDLMIGREIMMQGVEVHMTFNKLSFVKTRIVESCNIKKTETIDLQTIDTDVPSDSKSKLIEILESFRDSFIVGTPRTPADTAPMQIRLKDPHKTVNRRPYRLSPAEREAVRIKIVELLEANIIRPSSSPFSSPILLVQKKDGSQRLCVDYRELNDNTIPDRFPLPLISDQIARLHGGHYFTVLDMASGFHQVPIEQESIERTAFVSPDGQFEYLTMPFGLRNAPSVFQRAIVKALGDLVHSYVVVYVDDVMIVGGTVAESLERLKVVLETLSDKNFSLNIKKCSFLKEKVEYLGYEVSQGQIRPNPRKIEALTALPPPETITQLRQFIGLASYFRQFVSKFSQTMAPLYSLTSGKGKLTWKPEHEKIRQQIISALTNEPVLSIYDPDLDVELHTDASAIGYGAILLQKKEGKMRAVAYFSKRTTDAESKYHSYELETLAVVNAVKHFRHFLHGRKFLVVTDCNSLQMSRKKLDLAPRVHRWWAFLQSFDFDIIHREGKRMAHVDFFSRNPLPVEEKVISKVEKRIVNFAELSDNWLLAEQQRDQELSQTLADYKNKELPENVAKTYELKSGVLHRKIQRNGKTHSLPIVPRSLRWSIINNVHEGIMHLGWQKTLEKVFESYWFEHMAKYVRRFVENCVTCKVSKSHSGKIQAELHPIPKVAIPWHTVHIDATGKLSGKNNKKEYVFVLIDAFTKYVFLHHTLQIDTVSSIKALKACVSLFGTPVRVIADQGRCFASRDFKDYCNSVNIKLHLIATGSSRANGQVERVMSTLKNMLTAVEVSKKSWQDSLQDIQLALNCTQSRVTKFSPLELLIGKVARPLDVMFADDVEPEVDIEQVRNQAIQNMQAGAEYDKLRFDSTKAKLNPFSVGDFVLLQNEERNQTKLDPKYKGPFKVSEVLEGNRYILKSLTSNRTYKYAHDRLRKMPDSGTFDNSVIDDESDDQNEST